MPTIQDTFSDATKLSSLEGSEVEGGLLLPSNLDEGVALSWSGADQYVEITGSGLDNVHTFTWVAWVKRSAVGQRRTIVCKDNAAGARKLFEIDASNRLFLFVRTGTTSGQAISTATILTDDQWHMVAGTYDDAGSRILTLYIDGLPVTAYATRITATGTVTSDSSAPYIIGDRPATAGDFHFSGEIDSPRIFNVALTDEQIYKIYSTGENPSTPLGWWKFNAGSGVTATDSGSGGNNGDLTGHAPTWTTSHNPFYARRARATSTDLVTGLGATAVNSLAYTIGKKPGGSELRLGFASDGSTFKNSNGDLVGNTGGYSFDGVDDVASKAVANYRSSDTSGSISCWVRKTNSSQGNIFGSGDEAGSFVNWVAVGILASGVPYYSSFGTANATLAANGFNLNDNQLHHIVVTSSGSTTNMYIDGVLVTLTATTGSNTGRWFSNAPNRDNITVGNVKTSSFGAYFGGTIDDVRVFSQTLTDSEVWSLYANSIQPYTPVGWWKLDGNGTDSGSGGNDLTISGATALTEFSSLPSLGQVVGDVNVLSFDGVNDYAEKLTTNFRGSDFSGSIAAWVYIAGDGVSANAILSSASDAGSGHYFLFNAVESGTSNTDQFRVQKRNNSGTNFWVVTTATFTRNRWRHVVLTSSGTAWKIYVDGVSQALSVVSGSNNGDWFADVTSIDRDNVSIGRWSSGFYMNGSIADVAVYSAELSATQIYTDFKNGYPSTTNLVNYWAANEGTGSSLVDAVGGLDMTISGATWTKDSFRPEPNTTPPQRSISLSSLSLTSAAYYWAMFRANNHDRAAALDEVTLDYTASAAESRTATGGAVGGGTATFVLSFPITATGGAVGGGTATFVLSFPITATGGAVGGGSATFVLSFPRTATGGAVGGGVADFVLSFPVTTTGGAVGGGSATFVLSFSITATGGAVGGGLAVFPVAITTSGGAVGGGIALKICTYTLTSRIVTIGSGSAIFNPYRGTLSSRFFIGQTVTVKATGYEFVILSIKDVGTETSYWSGDAFYSANEIIDSRSYHIYQRGGLQYKIDAANRRLERLASIETLPDPQNGSLVVHDIDQTVYYLVNKKVIKSQIKSAKIESNKVSYKLKNGDVVDSSEIMSFADVREYINGQIEVLS